jgi:hypothetical protein
MTNRLDTITSVTCGTTTTTLGIIQQVVLYLTWSTSFWKVGGLIRARLISLDLALIPFVLDFYIATEPDNWDNDDGWDIRHDNPPGCHGVEIVKYYEPVLLLDGSHKHELRTSISELNFGGNGIRVTAGGIPIFASALSNLKKLVQLDLSDNLITGNVLHYIDECPSLEILKAEHSNINGELPKNMGDLVNLKELKLSGNLLVGQIPESISSCLNLECIDLQYNRLSGSLPDQIGNLKKLEQFDASHNRLSGKIPWSFGSCEDLIELDLAENQLSGEIPVEFGHLRHMVNFDYRGNSGIKLPEILRMFCEDEWYEREYGVRINFTKKHVVYFHKELLGIEKAAILTQCAFRVHEAYKRVAFLRREKKSKESAKKCAAFAASIAFHAAFASIDAVNKAIEDEFAAEMHAKMLAHDREQNSFKGRMKQRREKLLRDAIQFANKSKENFLDLKDTAKDGRRLMKKKLEPIVDKAIIMRRSAALKMAQAEEIRQLGLRKAHERLDPIGEKAEELYVAVRDPAWEMFTDAVNHHNKGTCYDIVNADGRTADGHVIHNGATATEMALQRHLQGTMQPV